MKPLSSPVRAATEAHVKVPTRRALAKQQTRQRVLAAARRLFSEQGYEGATIRDIAAAAGMSTGAVFANFADKSDLFREIMISDLDRLAEMMREAVAHVENVEEALVRLFGAGYAFYRDQLPLARAAFCVSWSPDSGQDMGEVLACQAMRNLIADLLTAGAARGELIADPQVKLRARMLFDCYLSNFPHAIFGGLTPEALQDRARAQIRILLAGARRG